jgi:C_GCAxxG_C_C family probable redox protein
MDRSDHAVDLFTGGLNCAQAVFAEFAEDNSLDLDLALRIACGFGGGMGQGDMCGAVTGGIMAIGLISLGPDPRDPGAKAATSAAVRWFVEEFRMRHGACLCRDLLGCDISTPEGLQEARGRGLMQTRCPEYVRDAVQIIEEMV